MALATATAMAATYLVNLWLPSPGGMLGGFVSLVVAGGIGLAIAFSLCALFRIPQMQMVTDLGGRLLVKLHLKKPPRGKHARR